MSKHTNSSTQNLTKSREAVSFGLELEEYMNCPATLYRLENDSLIACSDKHVAFYISDDQPRYFFKKFAGADYVLCMHVDLCTYLLDSGKFILASDITDDTDLSRVSAVLHFKPNTTEQQRMYLDEDSFNYLMEASTHRAIDRRGNPVKLSYHDDSGIGTAFKLQLNLNKSRLSPRDLFIYNKFKSPQFMCIAVYEGRGWMTIIDAVC